MIILRSALFCFITVLMIASTNVKIYAEVPAAADISVSGIYLQEPNSVIQVLGKLPEIQNKSRPLPYVNVCNDDGKEILKLIFHNGDIKGSFSEFVVQHLNDPSTRCVKPVNKIDHFVSGQGVKLGITKEMLIDILGNDFKQEVNGTTTIIYYRIEDFKNSSFLKQYNMPSYFGAYYFTNNKLSKFVFGFEYP